MVAVVVTCNPGPWFEECLAALAAQDYPNLSVLVIDAFSDDDPTERVASILPRAFVRRLTRNAGFGASANEAIKLVEGASHYLFCHDDVAPDPEALRMMVAEAYRSNAGVVAPKLVAWHAPDHLLAVGMGADKTGAPAPRVERGELDQEQHDSVRDVFVAPGALTLVRADLFEAIGGFDPEMVLYGEDLDLSWRSQVAGARVVVAPAARVRHLEATGSGARPGPDSLAGPRGLVAQGPEELARRHELRCVLKNYNRWHRARVVPQMAMVNVLELVVAVITKRRSTGAAIVGAWRWNLARAAHLSKARARVRAYRLLPDHEVRALQKAGLVRLSALAQPARRATHLGSPGRATPSPGVATHEHRRRLAAGIKVDEDRREAGRTSSQGSRWTKVVVAIVVVVYLFGTRSLVGGHIPRVGEMTAFPGPSDFMHQFLNAWRTTGLGGASPAPTAFGLVSVAGFVLAGSTALVRWLLIVGSVPLGLWGVFRLGSRTGSRRAAWVAMVAYGAVPLAYNAFSQGRLDTLVTYGAFPWLVSRIVSLSGPGPEGLNDRESVWRWKGLVSGGLVVALAGALVPSSIVALAVAVLGLAAGSALVGRGGVAARTLALGLGSVVVGWILNLPWSWSLVAPGAHWSVLAGLGTNPAHAAGLGALMRFQTGSLGNGTVGWAIVLAAVLPLVIGRRWRFEWAARLWVMALFSWFFAWAGGRGWLGAALPPGVFLVPAALALALNAALGVRAFDLDLPGYRFGWRQAATAVAAVALAVAVLPVLADSVGGRWNTPGSGFNEALAPLAGPLGAAPDRVLWVGSARALPLRGWELRPGQAYGLSVNGFPDSAAQWPQADPGAARVIATDLALAESGMTVRLGSMLAAYDVAWVVVPNRLSPNQSDGAARAFRADPALLPALVSQTDLSLTPGDPSASVLKNTAFKPRPRSALGHSVYIPGHGLATLGYHGSPGRYAEVSLETLVWLLAIWAAWKWRRRS